MMKLTLILNLTDPPPTLIEQKSQMKISITNIICIFAVPPMIWIKNQLIGAYEGQPLTLECGVEAYPQAINFWSMNDETIPDSKFVTLRYFFPLRHLIALKYSHKSNSRLY